jgi:hypothetical protein
MLRNRMSIFRRRQDRDQFVEGVLSWLISRLAYFDPPQEDLLLEESPELIAMGKTRKAFGELGAALRIAHRVPELRQMKEIVHLREAWLEMARRRNIFFDARRRVHLFPPLAVAMAVLETIDEVPEQARRSLQNVLDRRYLDRTDRSPWRKLDLKYYLNEAKLTHAFSDDETLFAESFLVSLPALTYASAQDLYGITHLIFHFSDFGGRDVHGLFASHFDGIREYIQLALQVCRYEMDFDLTAELLMCMVALGSRGDPLSWEASDALRESQQPSGFIPDRAWLAGLEPQPAPEDAIREEFFAVYHPTVVALFLVACDMCEPPAKIRSHPG